MTSANKLKPTVYVDAVPDLAAARTRPPRAAERRRRRRRTRLTPSAWIRGMRMRRLPVDWLTFGAAAIAVAVLSACASRVLVPPRIDLTEYYRIGLVTFTIENAKGSLHELATERFAQEIFANQYGVELLELGEAERVLGEIEEDRFDVHAARAIGDVYDIPAVFVGHLKVSNVRPQGALVGIRAPRVAASVDVEMTVRLLSTESGATLWSNTGRASETVGELGLGGGEFFFHAENPKEAYGRLVDVLIHEITRDFRPQRVRRR